MKTKEAIHRVLRPRTPGEHLKQAITVAIPLGCATVLLRKYSGVGAVTDGYFSMVDSSGCLRGPTFPSLSTHGIVSRLTPISLCRVPSP